MTPEPGRGRAAGSQDRARFSGIQFRTLHEQMYGSSYYRQRRS